MHLAAMILPIFAIIVTGWLAGGSGYVPRTLAAPLIQFAYHIARPALVFLVIAQETLGSLFEPRFIAAFGGGSMLCFAFVLIVARLVRGKDWAAAAMIGAAASMTNTGQVRRVRVAERIQAGADAARRARHLHDGRAGSRGDDRGRRLRGRADCQERVCARVGIRHRKTACRRGHFDDDALFHRHLARVALCAVMAFGLS